MPKVSIVIPNYNHSQFVSTAIQSVLDQTYHSFEIIVVDDGSTDNSREMIAQYGNQVCYIWQENQGLAGARNTGICAATGELIGLLDADDQWLPTYLETMVALAHRHPTAAVYYCQARCMNKSGEDLPQMLGGPVLPPHEIHQTLLRANFLIPSTLLLWREIIIQAGLFDSALRSCEDWDLWLRMLPAQTFVGTADCLVRYRQHNMSLSKNLLGMHNAARAVIEKNFGTDDDDWQGWNLVKRRAFGGLYRYFALTFVQRQNDWHAATPYLQRALQIDPTLATDIDLFYDLALGTQPVGYRGTAHAIDVGINACAIQAMLAGVFDGGDNLIADSLRRQVFGTAFFALGLVAYNCGQLVESRRHLLKALYYRPDLWHDPRVLGNFLKSFVGHGALRRLRQLRGAVR